MKTKPTRTRGTTLLAVLGLALGGHAQTLIPATSMTAEARHNYASREPGRVLNGVSNGGGFTADGSITTAALPADYRLDSTVGGTGTFGQLTNWTGDSATLQWFRVDLGADYSLDSMAFFNLCVNAAGAASTLNRGVLQADIYYRTTAAGPGGNSNGDGADFDATGWTLLGTAGTQVFTKVPAPGDTSIAPDVVSFGGVTARYVAFDINSAHSGSNVGIAELLFFESSGVPDPILNVAPGSPDPDYAFGNVFGGAPAPTRTVTLVNDSVGGSATINIDSVTITDDGGGVYGGLTVTYDAGNTGTPPLLENGDTVSIEIAASPVGSGSATGNLEILTTSAGGTVAADFNDKNLPLSAEVIPAGEKLNPNPLMESGLADWDNVSGDGEAVPVSPGLADGSNGMARVRGIGDASSTGPGDLEHPTSHMQSTGVPNGAPNWQLSAFFTPIDASTFGGYAEEATGATAADGAFSDRTFQLVVLSADTGRPFPGFDDAQAAGTLINLAYMPDGVQDNLGVADFYVFDGDIAGTAFGGTWIPTGIGAIEGSIDNDSDLSTTNGVGDGLLDPSVDPNDVVNAYRILVTGTGFGSPGASYDITVTKVSGPDTFVSGTATGLTAFQGVSGDSGTPAGYSFITSDVSSDPDTGSNQGDGGVPGLATPFWVDDVCFFNVAGPDPSLTVANIPGRIAVCSPDTTATTSFTIRNDGTSNNLGIDSISFSGATGFSVNSPGIPFSVAAGASQEITIEWDSAAAGDSLETATVTVSDSTNGLSSDLLVKGGLASGGSVVLDYNDHLSGTLAQAGNADTGIGFTESLWNNGTGTQVVVAGDLSTTTVPGYSVPATGTPQSQSTNNTAARQQERQIDLGSGITPVWFSFLAQKPTSGGRVGVGFNTNTTNAADPRLLWIGNLVAFRTGNANVATAPLTSTSDTQLIVGRISINDRAGGEDRIEVWVNPGDMSSVAALGAPDINYAGTNSLGNGLTRLNPSAYGATGGDAPILDNVRLSDLKESEAFDVIRTGSVPPALNVLDGPDRIVVCSPDTSGTATVTIRNEGNTTGLNVDSISFAGGTGFSITSPGIPFPIAPRATETITIEWDSATAGGTNEGATMTISDSVNALSTDLEVRGGLGFVGGSVVLDYNDHVPGDMAQAANSGTGVGFTEALWNSDTDTQVVVAGDISTTTVTGYSVPASGTAQSQSTTTGSALAQERQVSLGGGVNPVWFSFIATKPTSGGRVGFGLNTVGTTSSDPRLLWLNNSLQWRANGNFPATPLSSTSDPTVVVGRITINVGSAGEDRIELWAGPTDLSSIAALGSPDLVYEDTNSLGSGISRINPTTYGGVPGNEPGLDNLRFSDLKEDLAFGVIRTGIVPVEDPLLEVDAGDSPDFTFDNIFTASGSRTMTFVNNSDSGSETVTINSVSVTSDPGGVFGSPIVTYSGTNVLGDGDTVTIEIPASFAGSGAFTGELTIDTTSTGLFDPDNNDQVLPLSVAFYIDGEKIAGGNMEGGLGDFDGTSAAIAPGIAPGSSGGARVAGAGDPSGSGSAELYQADSVPDGADMFEFTAYFSPIDTTLWSLYTGFDPNGNMADRSFQWVLFGADSPQPDDPDGGGGTLGFDSTVMANALINIAYLPDGDSLGGTPGFYIHNGSVWGYSGIGALQGSVDNGGPAGDGLLDASVDPLDIINVYKLSVRGTGFGTGTASYDITVTKVSGPDSFTSATAAGLTAFSNLSGNTNTPAAYGFATSDTSSSGASSTSTPFWVDDVCLHAGVAPDPLLTVLQAPGDIIVLDPDTDGTTTLLVRNDGRSANLDLSSLNLTGTGFSLLSPSLPVTLSPFDTQALVLRFDSAAIAPELAAITTATLNSTELFEPSRTYNLTGAITSFAKLLPNWNFEVGGFDTTLNTDTFAAWTEGPSPTAALAVPGLIAGTSTAVRLDPGTEVAALFGAPANDFVVEFVAAYEDSGGREFNFFVRGQDASQVNIRYEGGVFSAFNSATSWEPIITVAVPASIDGNGDGDLEDGGDTKNLFKVRFTGTAWGTASPTYEVEILDAGGSLLATSGPGIAFYQNSAPTTGGVREMVITSEFGGIAGMWVDNVCASGSVIVPDADIVITASSFDPVAGTGSVTFTSVDGVPYSLRASNDLNQTDLYSAPGNLIDSGPGTGTSTTFNFSDPGMVGQSFRSYRVESP